jgi:hypothetical protein
MQIPKFALIPMLTLVKVPCPLFFTSIQKSPWQPEQPLGYLELKRVISPSAGGATLTCTAPLVALVPAALTAVAVQLPEPALAPAVTVMLPPVAVPVPEPLTPPVQLAELLTALLAVQLNVTCPPGATLGLPKLPVTLAGLITSRVPAQDASPLFDPLAYQVPP